ncbi:MAG: VWA domain-containing protein, partial [Thermomicrobiales bacterium]
MPRFDKTRYSRWDGTQLLNPVDANDVMNAMSEELIRDGDLLSALRRLFWEGIQRPDGERMPGLRDLMNRLRQERQQQLGRYDLGSVLDDIREQLEDIVDTERSGIQRRLDEAGKDESDADPEGESDEGEQGDLDRDALRKMLEK